MTASHIKDDRYRVANTVAHEHRSTAMDDTSDKADADWALDAPAGELIAFVWYCGDDWCGCSEAQIRHIVKRNASGGIHTSRTLWSGKFRSDHEFGATTDLNREAARLRRKHHDLRRRIFWPWSRKA